MFSCPQRDQARRKSLFTVGVLPYGPGNSLDGSGVVFSFCRVYFVRFHAQNLCVRGVSLSEAQSFSCEGCLSRYRSLAPKLQGSPYNSHSPWKRYLHCFTVACRPFSSSQRRSQQLKFSSVGVVSLFVMNSETARDSGDSGVEWNRQFSFLVGDANLETLEILLLEGSDAQGRRKPLARCKVPLRR